MHEACFCGWSGALAEREPTYLGDGDWGLACPRCDHLDRLELWPAAAREALIAEARRRREMAVAVGVTPSSIRAAKRVRRRAVAGARTGGDDGLVKHGRPRGGLRGRSRR
jgi:hypothetical protein